MCTPDREVTTLFRQFAEYEAHGESPSYESWALGVASDQGLARLVAQLPQQAQQPNRVFAAARFCGAVPGDSASLRRCLTEDWEHFEEVVLSRGTQTNEVGRCATLLPVLAGLPQPLALLEVGASAGLCLMPDAYSYRYSDGTVLHPGWGPSEVSLECEVSGGVPVPGRLPLVIWRAGIDLNPLDVTNADHVEWLENLIWPEHADRLERLRAAVEIAKSDPPLLVRGDLNERLPELVSQAPADATLVIFHSAVLGYLSTEARGRFLADVRRQPGHWISNEAPGLVDLTATHPAVAKHRGFVVALDGCAVGLAQGHGRSVSWL